MRGGTGCKTRLISTGGLFSRLEPVDEALIIVENRPLAKPYRRTGSSRGSYYRLYREKLMVPKSTLQKKPLLASPVPSKGVPCRFWLVKSEPECFSIDDLAAAKGQTTFWDGVRNYQARNMLRDQMQLGDRVLFYHSNAKPPGIAGVVEVVRAGYPDTTAFDPKHEHYDPKSRRETPTWYMVDLKLIEKFPRELGLPELRQVSQLAGMTLLQRGSRLSVQPVSPQEFKTVLRLAQST